MSSWSSSEASGASVILTAPEVKAGQILFSDSSSYSILEFIGEGCYGKVAKCRKSVTKEIVAVKILKESKFLQDTKKEVSMLEVISVLNPDQANVVKFFEQFEDMGHTCLAFEMLDRCLYGLLEEREWKPLSLNEIRPIANQLLVALDALKGLGVLHTDIKPDNIMCVNKQDRPLRVKLIDFGTAVLASKVQPGMALQPTGYRSPEIALGLPFSAAIDVWGVGCILAFLYLADNLFPVDCEYQMMKCMVELLGQPEDHLLRAGKYTHYYFTEEEAADSPTWKLMTPEEYEAAFNVKPEERQSYIDPPSSLDDLVYIYPEGAAAEFEDRRHFADLMKRLLHLDGDLRICPHRALQHSFITSSHLTEHPDIRENLVPARMNLCSTEVSGDRVHTSAACTPEQESCTGFYARGLSSSSNGDVPASWSSDGTKAIVPYNDKRTMRSSDRDQFTVPAAWSSDEDLYNGSYDEDPGDWYSEGEIPDFYNDLDPAAWSSDGESLEYSNDEDPATKSSDGETPKYSNDEDPATKSSDGETPKYSNDEDPATKSSDGQTPEYSDDKDPATQRSDGETPKYSNDEDPASRSSDGAQSADSTDAASASTSRTQKRLKRIRRFFGRIATTFCCCFRPTVED